MCVLCVHLVSSFKTVNVWQDVMLDFSLLVLLVWNVLKDVHSVQLRLHALCVMLADMPIMEDVKLTVQLVQSLMMKKRNVSTVIPHVPLVFNIQVNVWVVLLATISNSPVIPSVLLELTTIMEFVNIVLSSVHHVWVLLIHVLYVHKANIYSKLSVMILAQLLKSMADVQTYVRVDFSHQTLTAVSDVTINVQAVQTMPITVLPVWMESPSMDSVCQHVPWTLWIKTVTVLHVVKDVLRVQELLIDVSHVYLDLFFQEADVSKNVDLAHIMIMLIVFV